MPARVHRFIALLLLAVFSTTSLLGVGLHVCVASSHLDSSCHELCVHAACYQRPHADQDTEGQARFSSPDHTCPVCRFLSKWQSPSTADKGLEFVSSVTIVSEIPARAPFSPDLSGYLARGPPWLI